MYHCHEIPFTSSAPGTGEIIGSIGEFPVRAVDRMKSPGFAELGALVVTTFPQMKSANCWGLQNPKQEEYTK